MYIVSLQYITEAKNVHAIFIFLTPSTFFFQIYLLTRRP